MLTALVVIVFTLALAGGLAVCACSCRGETCPTQPQQTWWRAKGLSVFAEPAHTPHRAPAEHVETR